MSWLVALKMEGRLEGAILTDLLVFLTGDYGLGVDSREVRDGVFVKEVAEQKVRGGFWATKCVWWFEALMGPEDASSLRD